MAVISLLVGCADRGSTTSSPADIGLEETPVPSAAPTAPALMTPDPLWKPSPGTFPRDVAVAWCQLGIDFGRWGKALSTFHVTSSETPDLATVRATVPGILAEERPAAEAIRTDLTALLTYEATSGHARTVRAGVDAIEATLGEFAAASETTDLAALASRYLEQSTILVMSLSDMEPPSGAPENCSTLYPPTPTAVPIATPARTPRVSSSGWEAVTVPGSGWISAIVPAGAGYLAVGGADEEAAVFTSTDGLHWSLIPPSTAPSGGTIASVAVGRPGFIAVGRATPGEASHAAVWTSRDGTNWSRVPDDPVFASAEEPRMDAAMYDVAASGGRLVAVGAAEMEVQPAIWTSSDGLTWRRPRHFTPGLAEGGGTVLNGRAVAVTNGGPGFVAVGGIGGEAAVWYSADGLDWEQVPSGPWSTAAEIFDVSTAPSGLLVAVGRADDSTSEAAVWTSHDGKAWSRVPATSPPTTGTEATEPDGSQMFGVTSNGPGWVAVGSLTRQTDSGTGDDGAVWTSTDGQRWTLETADPIFDNASLYGVFATDTHVVVTGVVYDDPERPIDGTWARAR